MRRPSPVTIAALLLLLVALIAQAFTSLGSTAGGAKAVPGFVTPQICPPATPSGFSNVTTSNIVSAAGDDAKVRALTRSAKPLLRALEASRSLRVQTPVAITGREQSGVLSSARLPVWIASNICQAPTIDSWFIGGSGAVDSQSRLTLTNPAASDATVEITTWTNNGAVAPATLVVNANSSSVVSVDRFALGSNAVALRVRALSGRVAASLFDVRARGLSPLGADFVPVGVEPRERQIVVGVVGGVASARLRLLAPGNEDAVARIDLVTGSDRFTPRGLDQVDLPAGRVVDVSVPLKAVDGLGALVIESNVPVVAGVYQPAGKGKRDFAWLATSAPLSSSALAIPTQFDSTLVLFAPARTTSLASTGVARGALPSISVTESTVLAIGLKLPRWLEANDQLFAAIVSRTPYGLSVDPLNSLTRSRARVTPLPAISVIAPR
jgi:hypothetical protein